jgi:hypothetical protein
MKYGPAKGVRWIEAFDQIPLLQILRTVRDLGLEEQYDTALRHRLTQSLGPRWIEPQKAVKVKPPRKTASKATGKNNRIIARV